MVLPTAVTAFTLGHGVTLIIARFVESVIAGSIVVVAVMNIVRPESRKQMPWLALGFGLIHGLGFSSVLADLGLPSRARVLSLLSFNVGIELADRLRAARHRPAGVDGEVEGLPELRRPRRLGLHRGARRFLDDRARARARLSPRDSRRAARYDRSMRLDELPGWVVDDVASVRLEVAPYVDATPQELWRVTQRCARAAMWAVRASDMPERALAFEDPMPESTRAAIQRLMHSAKRTP